MREVYPYDIEIKNKYLKQPTVKQIFDFINELDVSCFQFERYYSFQKGILKQVKGGYKKLPVRYWPIFYERIVPQYGTSYKQINNIILNKINEVPKKVANTTHKTADNHNRLSTLK